MQTFIKMVGSATPGGDHENLFRWYCDHANMLMRYPDLLRATLYRRLDLANPSAAPDYMCLYEFPTAEAFIDYSDSVQRKDASRIREQGWGADKSAVVQRSEYLRHLRRSFNATRQKHASGTTSFEAHCFNLGNVEFLDAVRWVDACVQRAIEHSPVTQAQIHRPENSDGKEVAAGEWLVVIERAESQATSDAMDFTSVGADEIPNAMNAEFRSRWDARYEEICQWER